MSAAGLPIGMQLIAGRLEEGLLFRIARAYEATTGWHTRRPTSNS
jgi:Asp-tRNA(Asn)/Glu-tRNA(Gln) amidotransferase A subunit family amidase